MKDEFAKLLSEINLAQGKEKVQEIEKELHALVKPNPIQLAQWVEEIGRLTPIETESVVDLAGAYVGIPEHRETLKGFLKKYSQDSHGWVRTKAKHHLEPKSVSLDGYRHGDRIFRKFLRPGYSVNRHDLREQEAISLVIDIEEDWKEFYVGSFDYEGMIAQFLYLRSESQEGETVFGLHGWLGLGRLFEPGNSPEVLMAVPQGTDGYEYVMALAEEWAQKPVAGGWFFHAEGSLLPILAPELYAQDPPASILEKLPPL